MLGVPEQEGKTEWLQCKQLPGSSWKIRSQTWGNGKGLLAGCRKDFGFPRGNVGSYAVFSA